MPRQQQLHLQLDNAMAYRQRIGAAVQPLTNAIKEVVIVIWTHIVLEVWPVGTTIAKPIFHRQEVIGPVVQTAARVRQIT